jgi:hypothetical protein
VCLALGGCHYLFQLNDLAPPVDASTIDAVPIDAYSVDAAPGCWSAAYTGDEDLDGILDGCDNCPLMDNQPQGDGDGDGVGDICDANPNEPLEKIAYFHPMAKFSHAEWTTGGLNGNWQDNAVGIQQANTGASQDVVTYAYVSSVDKLLFTQPMAQVIVWMGSPNADVGDRSAIALYLISGGEASDGTPGGIRCGMNFPTDSSTTAIGFVEKEDTANVSTGVTARDLLPSLITLSTLEPGKTEADAITPLCSLRTGPGVDEVVRPAFTASFKPDKIKIGLWAMNASATYTALFVTERR